MNPPFWDFDYRLVSDRYEPARSDSTVIVATRAAVAPSTLVAVLDGTAKGASVTPLLELAPIFWYRVDLAEAVAPGALEAELRRANVAVRYVTPATQGSLSLGERLDFTSAAVAAPSEWRTRERRAHVEDRSDGRWLFHEHGGVDVDRAVCGTGAGTRLAVIDDEAMDSAPAELDREVLVGTNAPLRSSLHGSLMAAWAVGRAGTPDGMPAFTGIAPDASARLYLIPKPGRELVNLPCAIVRAVDDGADVVVCATNVDGATTPLLDDALAFASKLGRGGKGTAVVMPTGREVSSPPGSVHASLTLPLGDPASDPRVLCVAPSGRYGGWFLWKDKRGRLRPFANRSPAVRIAAPGDDMAYPFSAVERMGHAESSGAASIAAGVLLLSLSVNPELTQTELYDLVTDTAVADDGRLEGSVADPRDLLPERRDPDGHDAKCGYGRISAARLCLSVADPICAALVEMGELEAARRYSIQRRARPETPVGYSCALARWSARVLRRDSFVMQTLKVLLRHLRLCAGHEERKRFQRGEALARTFALAIEAMFTHAPPPEIRNELEKLHDVALRGTRDAPFASTLDCACVDVVATLFWQAAGPESGTVDARLVGVVQRSA